MATLKKGRRIRGPKTSRLRESEIAREWRIVDVANRPLGRVASEIAHILLGKDKATFEPHLVMGDYVIVINAEKAIMTGNKMTEREIFSHTGYPGGQKRLTPTQMLEKDGTSLVKHAVKGMLPKNKLGAAILKNLYIYSGSEHSHEAQKPKVLNLNDLK